MSNPEGLSLPLATDCLTCPPCVPDFPLSLRGEGGRHSKMLLPLMIRGNRASFSCCSLGWIEETGGDWWLGRTCRSDVPHPHREVHLLPDSTSPGGGLQLIALPAGTSPRAAMGSSLQDQGLTVSCPPAPQPFQSFVPTRSLWSTTLFTHQDPSPIFLSV